MSSPLLHLPELPCRTAAEPNATQEQLAVLWRAGLQDHEVLDNLGVDQARWLIARSNANRKASATAPSPRRSGSKAWGAGVAVLVILAAGLYYLGQPVPEEDDLPSAGSVPEQGQEVGAQPSGANRLLAPSSERFSLGNVARNLSRARAQEQPLVVDPLAPGQEVRLPRRIGVAVPEGVVVLQAGHIVVIEKRTGDRVTFRHDFGRSEAASADLLPSPSPQP